MATKHDEELSELAAYEEDEPETVTAKGVDKKDAVKKCVFDLAANLSRFS
jgi:hypothetical protein